MEDFIKPDKVEEEIVLDAGKVIMCKTNKEGIFEFANEYFMEVSGYEEYELMGKSMFCIQHPDMPEVIFKMMWEKLLAKENFSVVIKNIAKTGKFYWSVTNFDFKIDEKGEIVAIYSKRIAASRESVTFFSKLYKTLLRIEKENGINASEKYLSGYLEEKRLNFKELVQQFYDNLETNAIPKAKKITLKTSKPNVVEEKMPIKNKIEVPKKTVIETKPIAETKPVIKTKSVIEKKPITETIPVVEKKSIIETKPIVESKPIIEAKPIVDKKPVIEKKPEVIEKIEEKKVPVNEKVAEIKKPIVVKKEVKIERKIEIPKVNKPIVEKEVKAKKVTEIKKEDKSKKSLFQKLFGKTDEEIEEERRRREKD